MTLAAENIAIKAENARLREALEAVCRSIVQPDSDDEVETIAWQALAQPAPTTPATDKAQEVIDAALTHRTPEWSKSRFIAAVEAYRGGA